MSKTDSKTEIDKSEKIKPAPTPSRCLSGAAISGILALALYYLTVAIATAFANTAVSTKNLFAYKIAIAVRTLVLGVSALGTGIFSLVTLGLIALAIQLSWQKLNSSTDN